MKPLINKNWIRPLLIALCSCSLALPAALQAQPPRGPDGPTGKSKPQRPDMMRGGGGPGGKGQHVDRFLNHLKEKDPTEYERLSTLRETDPTTFRKELRARLQKGRKDFIERQPNKDGAGHPGGKRRGPGRLSQDQIEKMQSFQKEMKGLVMTYRMAETDEAKASAREKIKSHAAKAYDMQIQIQQKELQRAEQELDRIRKTLENRISERNRHIEERLNQMLQEPAG